MAPIASRASGAYFNREETSAAAASPVIQPCAGRRGAGSSSGFQSTSRSSVIVSKVIGTASFDNLVATLPAFTGSIA